MKWKLPIADSNLIGHDNLNVTDNMIIAAKAEERERCARLCEGAMEAAQHSSDGVRKEAAIAMAASCAMLIRLGS